MDVSQITGAASSYARKYALNGLFAIDDTKDADSNHVVKEEHPEVVNAINNQVKHEPTEDQKTIVGNTISEPQQKRLFAIAKEMGVPKDVIVAYMKENYGIEHSNQIAKGDMYNDICEFVTNFNK
jgi:hypothetical protein